VRRLNVTETAGLDDRPSAGRFFEDRKGMESRWREAALKRNKQRFLNWTSKNCGQSETYTTMCADIKTYVFFPVEGSDRLISSVL